jgi:hypothetical protein
VLGRTLSLFLGNPVAWAQTLNDVLNIIGGVMQISFAQAAAIAELDALGLGGPESVPCALADPLALGVESLTRNHSLIDGSWMKARYFATRECRLIRSVFWDR